MGIKRLGRPHDQSTSEALLDAAERVMLSEGYSKLTVDRLVKEVGTTRPTFYRRYPNLAHLAFEIIVNHFGVGAEVDTGSLREDLIELQRKDVVMLSSPLMRNNLPGLLEEVRVNPEVAALYGEHFLKPRRDYVGVVVQRAIRRGELPGQNVDLEFLCDILLGPLLVRVQLPVEGKLDDRLAHKTAELAFMFLSQ